jgi:hypothetical protein
MQQGAVQPAAAPYGVIYLPSLTAGTPDKQQLLLPLTLTYLLSAHLRFYLPLQQAALPIVERAFDQVINGNALGSKGIVYVPLAGNADAGHLLEKASLVVIDGSSSECISGCIPHAHVRTSADGACSVQLCKVEELDPELKAKLLSFAAFVKVQSTGFVTEGHFSLSW